MPPLSLDELEAGVLAGDRALLARAITLIESRAPAKESEGQELLERLLPKTGTAHRVGITGVPGVGKSTLIESLGMGLVEKGLSVAVLTVDPSSSVSGGSILGDKSRMARLAQNDRAYIRPSPSGLSLGGVARRTRESMLLCEAAGFDVVLIETVGVGQSETMVSDMVDTFVMLMLAGAGDELQGIKRGIIELADIIAVTKADGRNLPAARLAQTEISSALRYLRTREPPTQAILVSALEETGLDELWKLTQDHRAALESSGQLEMRRRTQRKRWMWSLIEEGLSDAFRKHPQVSARLGELEDQVTAGSKSATAAARELIALSSS